MIQIPHYDRNAYDYCSTAAAFSSVFADHGCTLWLQISITNMNINIIWILKLKVSTYSSIGLFSSYVMIFTENRDDVTIMLIQ